MDSLALLDATRSLIDRLAARCVNSQSRVAASRRLLLSDEMPTDIEHVDRAITTFGTDASAA
jgi:hypothetical protein